MVGSDQQHLDGQQVDEDHPLVLLTGTMTVVEGVGQEFLRCRHTIGLFLNGFVILKMFSQLVSYEKRDSS